MYIIGKTGMGKSTLLENLAIQDIQNGEGICFIDPHGTTAEKLLDFVPQDRIKDVMYFAPFDVEHPIAFNVMEDVGYDKRHLVVSGLMSAFHRVWGPETWSARMEYILQNSLLALLEYPQTTLVDINRLLSDGAFRKKVVAVIKDPIVKRYWQIEFAQYTDRYKQEAVPAIQNKIGQFVSNPLTRNIVAQPVSSFDMRKMMDERKIVIVNLSKGRIGEQNADLLGSILVVKMYLAAMSRAEVSHRELAALPPFYLYIDEFQSVVNDAFANILSESRKYKLCLTIAHQYVEQMPEEVQAAVFGNVGTTISFRIGPHDAETLEKIFDPTFTAQDLVGLGFAQVYLTLMIDGVGSKPFSAQTLPPINEPEITFTDEIKRFSREMYGTNRQEVENAIFERERSATQELIKGGTMTNGNTQGGGNRNHQQGNQHGGQQKSSGQQSSKKDEKKIGQADHKQRLKEALEKWSRKEAERESRKEPALTQPVPSPIEIVAPEVVEEELEKHMDTQPGKKVVSKQVDAPNEAASPAANPRSEDAHRGQKDAESKPVSKSSRGKKKRSTSSVPDQNSATNTPVAQVTEDDMLEAELKKLLKDDSDEYDDYDETER
jgi:hypothetical protein